MTDPISRALAEPAEDGIGLILHLGAGTCRELAAYLACGATDVVLVEPEPVAARTLAQRIIAHAHVRLLELAVAPEDGPTDLQLFNLAPLSSLRPPAELARLFPGLCRVTAVPVMAVTPGSLLAMLPPQGAAPDILVIDTPGEEATVIAGLAAAGALARFHEVFLHAGTGAHYVGSVPLALLLSQLEAVGHRLVARDDSDPDRPCLHLRRPVSSRAMQARCADQAACGAAVDTERHIRNALARYASALAAGNRALAERAEAQAEQIVGLNAALARAEAALARRDVDLAELRDRHAALVAQAGRRDGLVAQLTDGLTLAAAMWDHPDGDSPGAPGRRAAGNSGSRR